MKKIYMLLWLLVLFCNIGNAYEVLKWEDVYYTSGPYAGAQKVLWEDRSAQQKAEYLELHNRAVKYCLENIGKSKKELNPAMLGSEVYAIYKVTPEVISMMYRAYGDLRKAAEYRYRDWIDSKHSPELMNADEPPQDYVASGYVEAGMYKELAEFYSQAYDDKMKWLGESTDLKLLKSDFKEYSRLWPDYAKNYQKFMRDWGKAKKLAQNSKPKPLDPAVQNHEWFYSEKPDEILRALRYYYKHKVRFMLEEALNHKSPTVSEKAREYLDKLDKVAGK